VESLRTILFLCGAFSYLYFLYKYVNALDLVCKELKSQDNLKVFGITVEPTKLILLATPKLTATLISRSYMKGRQSDSSFVCAHNLARKYFLAMAFSALSSFLLVVLLKDV
jgi:hypothetical protein|tara:strand:+ start:15 stop:347 length:333 start_codon:yes stop_codon:yes gene_type:complete